MRWRRERMDGASDYSRSSLSNYAKPGMCLRGPIRDVASRLQRSLHASYSVVMLSGNCLRIRLVSNKLVWHLTFQLPEFGVHFGVENMILCPEQFRIKHGSATQLGRSFTFRWVAAL